MTKRILLIAAGFILTSVLSFAQGVATQEAMTNQDVLDMVKAKLSTEVIIKAIEDAKSVNFHLTPKALIRLKQAGVNDKIIEAMQSKAAGVSNPPLNGGRPPPGKLPTAVGVFYQRSGTYEEIPQEMAKGRASFVGLILGPIIRRKTENLIAGKTSRVLISEELSCRQRHPETMKREVEHGIVGAERQGRQVG
jgi:hypothetical protein